MYRNENENYDITDLVVAWDNIPLTCGAIGSYVFTASKESYVATPKPSQVGLEKDRGEDPTYMSVMRTRCKRE